MLPIRPSHIVLALLLAAALALSARAIEDITPEAGMVRYPHVSATHIVFVYANDIWLVPREGGLAAPLASPPGQEVNPRFSPDGRTIAFVGNYDGQRDIYTMPIGGGAPHRVTYHPGPKNLTGWTSDGRLIYSSNFQQGIRRAPKLYTISAEGGPPEPLPVPYGDAAAISPDGKWGGWLAYTPQNADRRTWKRYRGGLASNIWLFNIEDQTSRQMTDWEGTDTLPMWSPDGSTVYFLSDAGDEHRLNIWSYDMRTGRREQITRFSEWDVKWPSMGPGGGGRGRGEIVFQNGPSMYLLDLATRQSRAVPVRIPGARPLIRTQAVDAARFIQSWNVSPNAKRAVVQARGDVWTLPAEKGSPRNLTRTSGVAERDPSWSPCGRWIAYFSDESGEYELYITQSDGRGETRQLTSAGDCFKYNPQWSPCSKYIVFTDKTSSIWMVEVENDELRFVDKDPWGRGGGRNGGSLRVSWSHDSRWITYAKTQDRRASSAVWVYDVENDEHHQLTSGIFNDVNPAFDRKGDWLFYATNRSFTAPVYSDLDTTWAYTGSQVLVAAPLRDDVKSPWLPESDEETWKDDEDADEDEEENGEDDAAADDDEDEDKPEPRPDDGVSGTWEGTANVPDMGPIRLSLIIRLADDNSVSGTLVTDFFSGPLTGRYDPAGRTLTGTADAAGMSVTFDMKIDGETMTGAAGANDQFVDLTLQRTSKPGADEKDADEKPEARETVAIDLDGFERRALMLPVPSGRFGRLAVNDKNHLIFARLETPGSSATAGIKLFDLSDEKKQEQSAVAGATNFEITPDGKKLLVIRGGSASIQNAAAGASGTNIATAGMIAHVNPREEWRQLFTDVWRIQRDFFYVDNLHGVDWPAVRDHYEKMLADAASREDVSFIVSEMISELNVGHAYYWGGDGESEPSVNVGSLGADFQFDREAGGYRISAIHTGGDWDVDARGPLSQPGVDVKAGDFLLEVNGVPVDPARDPYAAFQGLAGRTVTITVSEHPFFCCEARDVVVQPVADDGNLRYRAWIERNRAYVDEQTGGRVGYIYVPNTGVEGQSELMRQYYAQLDKDALIIDERWNGGGQIPTRFIEMLNRPVTNYWARRDNNDWRWPPDAHQGPKVMLINGPAGSGGDMFPWLFRHNNLGKLIGTRTWGGLVGISGNPGLIDGGYTAVPTFGFYTADGRWSIEGHGVDPCIEVIDDPALMVNGGDPQLDAAIELMRSELENNAYSSPARPAPPDRRGWGIDPAHR
jgi:tricorn protease